MSKEKMMNIKNLKSKILNYFQEKDVVLIYIFGSHASGQNKEDSDIDIAILYKKKMSELEVYEDKINLVDILDEEVDLIDLEGANLIIKHQIVTKGLNIYSEEKSSHIEYKYRTIVCYEGFRDDSKIVRDKIKERGYVWKK